MASGNPQRCDDRHRKPALAEEMRGWWNMPCWNGLSAEQQERLIKVGNLPIYYTPEGECSNGAEVEITTMWDESPGPRFYCLPCAAKHLQQFQPPTTPTDKAVSQQ